MNIFDVEQWLNTVTKPDPIEGLSVRRCLFSFALIDERPPALMELLDSIKVLEKALLKSKKASVVDPIRKTTLKKLNSFKISYPSCESTDCNK